MPELTVGLVQFACGEEKEENIARALRFCEEAAEKGARVICLQELFATRYFPQEENHAAFDLAEPIPGPITERFAEFARQKRVAVICPLFEKAGPGVYFNSLAVLGPSGDLLGRYRKMHIPDDPLYFEKFYFSPGDLGFRVFNIGGVLLGPLICWDQWFPEAARIVALKGAMIIFYPTAIGWHAHEKESEGADQLDAWVTIQRAHAIANGVFVVAVNRVGVEGTVQFWGNSFVADPFGRLLARAGEAEEGAVVVRCDLSQVERVRRHWPFLRDRRIDAYQEILCRFAAGEPVASGESGRSE